MQSRFIHADTGSRIHIIKTRSRRRLLEEAGSKIAMLCSLLGVYCRECWIQGRQKNGCQLCNERKRKMTAKNVHYIQLEWCGWKWRTRTKKTMNNGRRWILKYAPRKRWNNREICCFRSNFENGTFKISRGRVIQEIYVNPMCWRLKPVELD